jgi:hypothetical protein
MGHEKMQVKPQTNPKQGKQGMDIFLNPSPISNKQSQVPVQDKSQVPVHVSDKQAKEIEQIQDKPKIEEIEQVEQIERMLLKNIKKELDFSTFNELVFKKKLQFRLLLIKSRIYVVVRDPGTNKSTVIAVSLPKWGGSSLRYMALTCSDSWCEVVEKATSKGKVLTYKSSNSSGNDNDNIDDDIFD